MTDIKVAVGVRMTETAERYGETIQRAARAIEIAARYVGKDAPLEDRTAMADGAEALVEMAELLAVVAEAAAEDMGRRALALLLKHEWVTIFGDDCTHELVCPGCGMSHGMADRSAALSHFSDCEIGAIVAEVEKLRGAP